MFSVGTSIETGTVRTMVTEGRGLNADEITDMLMAKLLYVADSAPPTLREQAEAFRNDIRRVVRHYVAQAQKSQNTSIYNALMQAGHPDAAEVVRRL